MATPGALGQLEGFLANLNLGKYFEACATTRCATTTLANGAGPGLSMGAARR